MPETENPDTEPRTSPVQDTQNRDNARPPSAEDRMTDISFAGFQIWALAGLGILSLFFTLVSGGSARFLWLNAVLFTAAGAAGGCLIANRYGRKWGILFLCIPVIILAGGIVCVPVQHEPRAEHEKDLYTALSSIRSALARRAEEPDSGTPSIYSLCTRAGSDERGSGTVSRDLAHADYFHCTGEKKKSFRGYWFALVALNSEKIPYEHLPEEFALTAFPEEYGITGRYIYLMNEKGDFYRIDLGKALYIKRYPGPDPAEFGWERCRE